MVHCERCGSRFSSTRMRYVRHCPRCLLRSDVASPLVEERPGQQPPEWPRRQPPAKVRSETPNSSPNSLIA